MPYSMTGFACVKRSFEDHDIDVKVKSLNGKSLELSIKGDKTILTFLEIEIRKLAQQFFERGTLSVIVNVIPRKPTLNIDVERLKLYVKTLRETFSEAGLVPSDDKLLDYCLSLFSNTSSEEIDPKLRENTLTTLSEAFDILRQERKKEGEALITDIRDRLKDIREKINAVEQRKDQILNTIQQRMEQKIRQLMVENFSERAFIESSIIAQKIDITEEIVRLHNHIDSFEELIKLDGPVGRKMDFLCQEMHREINTLGNKIPDFSNLTVEIKTQIEKIRQQVQNIE